MIVSTLKSCSLLSVHCSAREADPAFHLGGVVNSVKHARTLLLIQLGEVTHLAGVNIVKSTLHDSTEVALP